MEQAKTASPLFAVGALTALGILWRQHIKDQNALKALSESTTRALLATGRALTKLATKIEGSNRSRR